MPKCYITQSGPNLGKVQDYAKKRQLSNVEFLGFVDISKLIDLYESCSVYVDVYKRQERNNGNMASCSGC